MFMHRYMSNSFTSSMLVANCVKARLLIQQNDLRLDMNIEGVWRQGITGKGVTVTILDDGR